MIFDTTQVGNKPTTREVSEVEKNLLRILAYCYIPMAIILFALALKLAYLTEPADGVVLSNKLNDSNNYVVQFTTISQEDVILNVDLGGKGHFTIGQHVNVRYPLDNPYKAYYDDFPISIHFAIPAFLLFWSTGVLIQYKKHKLKH